MMMARTARDVMLAFVSQPASFQFAPDLACNLGRRFLQKQLACFMAGRGLGRDNSTTNAGHYMPTGATPVISATGLFTPSDSISNEELVASFNAYVELYNAEHPGAEPLQPSSVEFVEKASGIKSRHVIDKAAILDPAIMEPRYPERPNDQISMMAEIGVAACRMALERAGRDIADVDAVLCAASNMQRGYPAMAVEIQHELGMERGFGFDMNVACSSATFGIQTAADYIRSGNARSVLVVNPEITSGHLNWRDRDSHFIFGDVATAILVEAVDMAPAQHWEILGTRLKTQFSNNIRNNFGFLNRAEGKGPIDQRGPRNDKLFVQEGRKVFKEVVPMVAQMIVDHAAELGLKSYAGCGCIRPIPA
jgi:beta-ketodecanoyl-[acyl-carrier-protein] synthase